MTHIIAHRGYSGLFPENTVLAFMEAAKFPIWGIEIDVQMTQDGHVVIIHDETVDRTSNGTGWVKDMSLEELKKLHFSGTFPHFAESHADLVKIPTLEEFLTWMQSNTMNVNIELKTSIIRYPGIVDKVVGLIQHYQMEERVLISSFNHRSIIETKELAPNLACAFLTDATLLSPGTYCHQHGVEFYHPAFPTMDPEDIVDCQQVGVKINAYTVNEVDHMKWVMNMGMDGFFTNYIERALELENK